MISSCKTLAHHGVAGVVVVTYILADGNAAHTVLFAKLLTQWRLKVVRTCPCAMFQVSSYAHDDPTHTTRRTEVSLSRLAARACDCLDLGHFCCELDGLSVTLRSSCRGPQIFIREKCASAQRARFFSVGETVVPLSLARLSLLAAQRARVDHRHSRSSLSKR